MDNLIHSFDEEGYYLSSSPHPIDPVTRQPAIVNTAVATDIPLPEYDASEFRLRLVGAGWVQEPLPAAVEEPEPEPHVPTLEEYKADLVKKVNAIYTYKMSAIAVSYPQLERESWAVQIEEARLLVSDPNAVTPWIDECAGARGIDRMTLAEKIVQKDTGYRVISGRVTGSRHGHEDRIDALTSIEDAIAYDVEAGWPVSE